MESDRLHTVAFTGHRHYRDEASEALRQTLHGLYDEGMRTFLCGMAVGFDLAAAEAVVALRTEHPDVRLVAVLPFADQHIRFSAAEQARHACLTAAADERVVLSTDYTHGCFRLRNDFLVAHAACFVAWYDGRAGGTRYTFRQAVRRGLRVVNLAAALQPESPRLFGDEVFG